MRFGVVVATCLLFAATVAVAGDDAAAPVPTTLRLRPSKPAGSPFAIQLTPSILDQKPGNAAVPLYRATALAGQTSFRTDQRAFDRATGDWMDKPYDEFLRMAREPGGKSAAAALRSGLARFAEPVFAELRQAAACRECDWQARSEEGERGRSLDAGEWQALRQFGCWLVVAAELDLARGDFASAERSMQTAAALAQLGAKRNDLVSCLAAATVEGHLYRAVEHWVQTPDAPNLHWALASIPTPWIDLAPTLAAEREMDRFLGLAFSPRRPPPVGDPAWATLFGQMTAAGRFWEEAPQSDPRLAEALEVVEKLIDYRGIMRTRLAQLTQALAAAPAARNGLAARGWSEADLEKMSAEEMVLRWSFAVYRSEADDWFKWSALPYPQAAAQQKAILDRLRTTPGPKGAIPLAPTLLGAASFVQYAERRTVQRRAMLRIVELVRWSAAEKGAWPKTLAELPVAAPLDPVSGEPFHFVREEGKIHLASPQPAFLKSDFVQRYTLEFSEIPPKGKKEGEKP